MLSLSIVFIIFKIQYVLVKVNANEICLNPSSTLTPKYYLMEKCRRSKLNFVAKANYKSLESCQRLATEKRAMAINFSPPEAAIMAENETEPLDYTCEVLSCAEVDGGLSLANDTRYDYYSIYGRPLPSVNSSCVPGIGMFQLLTQPVNYSEGLVQCRNMTAELADVTSAQRTDALAQLLAGAGVAAVYVGHRRYNSSDFLGINRADSLDCTTYRAWEPGHPRRGFTKYDCMLLTQQRTWLSTSCRAQFPALCELEPGARAHKRLAVPFWN